MSEITPARILACVEACEGISTEELSKDAPFDVVSYARDTLRVMLQVMDRQELRDVEPGLYASASYCLAVLEGEPPGSTRHLQPGFKCHGKSGNWAAKRRGWSPAQVKARLRGLAAQLRQLMRFRDQ